jgi:hypothetical protein
MNSEKSSNWTRGQQGVLGIFIMAVISTLILFANQDNDPPIDQTLRVILAIPALLFIAPPGWAILGYIAQKLNDQPVNELSHLEQPTSRIIQEFDVDEIKPDHNDGLFLSSDDISDVALDTSKSFSTSIDEFDNLEVNLFHELDDAVFSSLEFAKKVANSYQWKCQVCQLSIRKDGDWLFYSSNLQRLVVEHIVPISLGGKNTFANAQPRHWKCLSPRERDELRKVTSNSFEINVRQTPKTSISRTINQSSWPKPTRKKSANVEYKPTERPGNWSSPHTIVNQLMKNLDTARISDDQRELAREFLMAQHVNDLMKACQRGHRMTLENTYFSRPADGYIQRQCRACRRLNRS